MKKICVVGLGYIGLPTAAVFAEAGCEVLGIDVNEKIINKLNQGLIHIEENGLDEVVKRVVKSGNLKASLKPEQADVFIIAVPTPIHEDFTANVDYVVDAAKSIVPVLKKGDVVIVESTIPPRTIDDIVAPILEDSGFNLKEDIYLAHCPERVLPGKILEELVYNTRIVGGYTPEAAVEASNVYRIIVKGDILQTEALTAEMSKLMENTFRDVNIALANELAKVSQKLGVNAHEVIELANKHPRVNIHLPGPGVGGHCLAVDPYFIVEKATDEAKMIKLARDINTSMPDFVTKQVELLVSEIEKPKIAVFGLAYKGNIDDYRESPAVEIYEKLKNNQRLEIFVHDPHIEQENINLTLYSFEEAVKDANLILILTDHNEFKNLTEEDLVPVMKNPVIFDTRNCLNIKGDEITVYKIGNLGFIKPV
ncbi:nucleotide sugar dehydrogenase [Metabacillus idriensis]|uniref:nucleotide sugar dehydrogenase n=1 Tax=Metabacillus idriensis TaxID=324768 RepID=UPI002966C98F|nr:nucleotide sugar dehydrogenase [Metabacillus idriensis]